MTVEQCVLAQDPNNPAIVSVASRVQLLCELVTTSPDGRWKTVKILEARAGLAVNDEITVPASKVTD